MPRGRYELVHRANPSGTLRETSYANNSSSSLLRIVWPTGYGDPPDVDVLKRCPGQGRYTLDARAPPGAPLPFPPPWPPRAAPPPT